MLENLFGVHPLDAGRQTFSGAMQSDLRLDHLEFLFADSVQWHHLHQWAKYRSYHVRQLSVRFYPRHLWVWRIQQLQWVSTAQFAGAFHHLGCWSGWNNYHVFFTNSLQSRFAAGIHRQFRQCGHFEILFALPSGIYRATGYFRQ